MNPFEDFTAEDTVDFLTQLNALADGRLDEGAERRLEEVMAQVEEKTHLMLWELQLAEDVWADGTEGES